MRNILNLFGKSPFSHLLTHMDKVASCVHELKPLFADIANNAQEKAAQTAIKISDLEHQADLTKNDIRNHLPKSLFLALDRESILEILSLQDSIADKAEDVAVLVTLKPLKIFPSFQNSFKLFLEKNIDCFNDAHLVVKELNELLESSFGGLEAEKVRAMVDSVAFKEHEADVLQRTLLMDLFKAEDQLTLSTFHIWQRIIENLSDLSNVSEKLAYRIRMTLEIK